MAQILSSWPPFMRWIKDARVITRLFRQDQTERSAAAVLSLLVEQSRQPEFYRHCGVPDTLDGRFDMLVLHAFIVLERLAGQGNREDVFAQALFDRLFAEMDVNLREMGVGDLSVGKKVRQMAEAFYGRAQAYRDGLADSGGDVLTAALRRNLFRSTTPDGAQIDAMAAYLRRECVAIAAIPSEDVMAARMRFGPAIVPAESLADG